MRIVEPSASKLVRPLASLHPCPRPTRPGDASVPSQMLRACPVTAVTDGRSPSGVDALLASLRPVSHSPPSPESGAPSPSLAGLPVPLTAGAERSLGDPIRDIGAQLWTICTWFLRHNTLKWGCSSQMRPYIRPRWDIEAKT